MHFSFPWFCLSSGITVNNRLMKKWLFRSSKSYLGEPGPVSLRIRPLGDRSPAQHRVFAHGLINKSSGGCLLTVT